MAAVLTLGRPFGVYGGISAISAAGCDIGQARTIDDATSTHDASPDYRRRAAFALRAIADLDGFSIPGLLDQRGGNQREVFSTLHTILLPRSSHPAQDRRRTKAHGEGRMPKLLWDESAVTKAAHQGLVAQIVQLIVTSPGGIDDRLFLLESVVTEVLRADWQKQPKLGLSVLAGQVEGRLDDAR